MAFKKITFDPEVMGGQACVRGLRIPVSTVVKLVTAGMTVEEILGQGARHLARL